jgi:hypothetical protein
MLSWAALTIGMTIGGCTGHAVMGITAGWFLAWVIGMAIEEIEQAEL